MAMKPRNRIVQPSTLGKDESISEVNLEIDNNMDLVLIWPDSKKALKEIVISIIDGGIRIREAYSDRTLSFEPDGETDFIIR